MKSRSLWLAVLSLVLAGLAAIPLRAAEGEEEEMNNGQDLTRPLTRFDIRYMFQDLPGSSHDNESIVTLRVDKPFELGPKWKLATRLDAPLIVTDHISNDNPNGRTEFGLGDVLAQALLINLTNERVAWAVGTQIVFPTATQDTTGTGTWRVVPTGAIRVDTHEALKGSWIAFVARWDRSFAHVRSDSTTVNELQLAPVINIPLPNRWFINLWPSTDIRYNFGDRRAGDKGKWFVPMDVMVGRLVRKNLVASLEVSVPMINDYRVYDFKAEFRLGFFF